MIIHSYSIHLHMMSRTQPTADVMPRERWPLGPTQEYSRVWLGGRQTHLRLTRACWMRPLAQRGFRVSLDKRLHTPSSLSTQDRKWFNSLTAYVSICSVMCTPMTEHSLSATRISNRLRNIQNCEWLEFHCQHVLSDDTHIIALYRDINMFFNIIEYSRDVVPYMTEILAEKKKSSRSVANEIP